MSEPTPSAEAPAAKPRRVQRPGKIRRLPPKLRHELNQRLADGDFSGYRGLSLWLEKKGFEISPSALNYYAHKFEQRLSAVKLATTQARAIVKVAAGDDDKLNQALMRMMQTTMFEMMVEMNDMRQKAGAAERARVHSRNTLARRAARSAAAGEGECADAVAPAPKYPTRADLALIGSVGRTVAALGKLDLEWEKWRTQMKRQVEERVDAAKQRVSEAASQGGLSSEAEARIRSALLEIKV